MYSDEYENEELDESEQQSGNFIVNFYQNNKVLVWVLLGIIIFVILLSIITKGGGKTTEKEIEYNVSIYPEGDVYVNIGRSVNLVPTVENDPKAQVTWSVEDENVVKVDNGNVTGLSYGTTTVTATYIDKKDEKHSDSKKVIVADGDPNIALADVAFKEGDLFMPINSTYQIALVLNPARGFVENESFNSSNPNVVTVDNKGLVKAVGEGDAVVSFVINNGAFSGQVNVHVSRLYESSEIVLVPEKISFDGEIRKIVVGTSEKLTYTITPQSADVDRLIWTSSDPNVVTVEKGVITGVSVGKAKVSVITINGFEDSIDVEVENDIIEVTEVDVTPDEIELDVGQSMTITPTVSPDDASNKALSYMSLDDYIAFVDPNDTGTKATITGISAGTTTIVVSSNNNIEKRIDVTVKDSAASDVADWDEEGPSSDYPGYNENNGGGYIGGSSSSSYTGQGFTISSRDVTGEGFITRDYYAGDNNEAIAPVVVTVTKDNNSKLDRLVIKVCKYATEDCILTRETSDTVAFTLTEAGQFEIVVEVYKTDGSLYKTSTKYIRIKTGSNSNTITNLTSSSGSVISPTATGNPGATVAIRCPKTVTVGEFLRCEAYNLMSGDSIKDWVVCNTVFDGKKYTNNNTTKNIKVQYEGKCNAVVRTTKGASASALVEIVGVNQDGDLTPKPSGNTTSKPATPKPGSTSTPRPSSGDVYIDCKGFTDKVYYYIGRPINCTAVIPEDDSVKEWSLNGQVINSKEKTIDLIASSVEKVDKLVVKTTNGGEAKISLHIIKSSTVSISCDKYDIKVGERAKCRANLGKGDKVKSWYVNNKLQSFNDTGINIDGLKPDSVEIKVETEKGYEDSVTINISGEQESNNSYGASVSITCTKTNPIPGEEVTCTAHLSDDGDRVKTWYENGFDIKKNVITINVNTSYPGRKTFAVKTAKGATASIEILISPSGENFSVTCDKTKISIKDMSMCYTNVPKNDEFKEWILDGNVLKVTKNVYHINGAYLGVGTHNIIGSTKNGLSQTVDIEVVPADSLKDVQITCDNANNIFEIGSSFRCQATIPGGDEIKEWSLGGKVYKVKLASMPFTAPNRECIQELKVVTVNGNEGTATLYFVSSSTPMPSPSPTTPGSSTPKPADPGSSIGMNTLAYSCNNGVLTIKRGTKKLDTTSYCGTAQDMGSYKQYTCRDKTGVLSGTCTISCASTGTTIVSKTCSAATPTPVTPKPVTPKPVTPKPVTPKPTGENVSISCTATSVAVGGSTICRVILGKGDSVKTWYKGSIDQKVAYTVVTIKNVAGGPTKWTVETVKGKKASVTIIGVSTTPTADNRPCCNTCGGNAYCEAHCRTCTPKPSGPTAKPVTPKPTGNTTTPRPTGNTTTPKPTVKISCTSPVNVGGVITCTASSLVSGDSVKEWNICSTIFSASGTTKKLTATKVGKCNAIVKTTKGASALTTITIKAAATPRPTGNITPKPVTPRPTGNTTTPRPTGPGSSIGMNTLAYYCNNGVLTVKRGTTKLDITQYCGTAQDLGSYKRYTCRDKTGVLSGTCAISCASTGTTIISKTCS